MSLLPSLSDAKAILGDPAYNFRWIVILPVDISSNLTSNFNTPFSYSSSGYTLQTPSVPIGRVENITLPGLKIEAEPRFGAGRKALFPSICRLRGLFYVFI